MLNLIENIEFYIRQFFKRPKYKGSFIPCFKCEGSGFLIRGFCEFCEPQMHKEFWRNVENAPSIESYY